jgi:hypothetical protein
MAKFGLIVAGIIGVVIGLVLLANPGFLGTLLGWGFLIGGIVIFVVGLIR